MARNFIPLVPSGTIGADADVAQLEQDVLAMDSRVGELAEDVGTIENWDAGDIPFDDSETYASGSVGNTLSDVKSEINNGAARLVTTTTLTALSTPMPFFAKSGDTITVKSVSGNFTATRVRFLDISFQNVAYWTLSSSASTMPVTIPSGRSDIYYVQIEGGTAQTVTVRNDTRDVLGTLSTNFDEIIDNALFRVRVKSAGVFIPFDAESGDIIKIETVDGSNFGDQTGACVLFSDINKTQISYFALASSYGNTRIVTYSNINKAIYVSSRSTQDDIVVTNVTKGNILYYSPNGAEIATKYISEETLSDRKNVEMNSDLKLVFFSDIHGSSDNMNRIARFVNAIGGVDAVINGGDTVLSIETEDVAWYNTAVAAITTDTLTCVGNHDAWSSSWVMANAVDIYTKFIAPVVSKVSDIIQPTGAATSGACYYYKDYENIRIIVLAAMSTESDPLLWDADQLTWLQSVLADAITNDKKIICVNHSPFPAAKANIMTESPINTWMPYPDSPTWDSIVTNQSAVDAVNTFITNGGEFICWLTGHTHCDNILTETDYSNQFMISIATARNNLHPDGYAPTNTDAAGYDCFDYIGIDTTNKLIKVWRIGYNQDASMRVRNRFCYDYENMQLMANS